MVEGQYKDAIYQFVTPVEDEAKKRWKDTLARAVAAGRHQRLRQEGAREPVEVPARRVPVHQGRAHRTGVPMMTMELQRR